jgi:hypothetical protein
VSGPALCDTSAPLAALERRLAALADRRGPRIADFRNAVQDVVFVASSSRGGSSVFAELLRHSRSLVHLQAEVNPFLLLAGLGPGRAGRDSDALPVDASFDSTVLDRELALDAGQPARGPVGLVHWAGDLAWRLQAQWPGLEVSPEVALRWLKHGLNDVLGTGASPERLTPAALSRVHLAVLDRARSEGAPVDPAYSDLPPALLDGRPLPEGPPGEVVLEEPPFVVPRPWQRATAAELARPLIIKTPSNVYRLDFLAQLFPRARVRVLHLVRNPAATINGLVDGWRYRGFHAHRLTAPLRISGYVDHRPGDRHWWKFDLPPGWQALVDQPLVRVAAFQWASAHRATLGFLRRNPQVDTLQVRFGDVIGPQRHATFGRIMDWLDQPVDVGLEGVLKDMPPPVMATAAPRARRWFARADELAPALALPEVRALVEELELGPAELWG